MRIRMLFLFLAMILAGASMYAQKNIDVKGVVLDGNNEPVIGASVVTGGNKRTVTDSDGRFRLSDVPLKDAITVSYIGYNTVTVLPRESLRVVLDSNSRELDEVMVVAFGEQKKSSFTGSAAVISSKDIENRQVTNVMNTLQGNVAGVQAITTSGSPDATPSFRIRGISSINAGKDPLVILDGMPYDGAWNDINPHDVESVTVLKDATSNALYGARGANGVIMVTTKKGQANKTTVTFDAKIGSNSRSAKDYETIDNPAEYLETHYKALYNYYLNARGQSVYQAHANANSTLSKSSSVGGLGYIPYAVPDGEYLIGDNGKLNPNATLGNRVYNNGNVYTIMPDDWVDETYRNALRQEYNLSLNGGSQTAHFYASLGYLKNEGIVKETCYERYTARMKADYQPYKWLKVGGNINFTHSDMDYANEDDDASNNIFTMLSQIAPIYPVYIRDADGNILHDGNGAVGDYGDGKTLGADYVRPYLSQQNGVTDNGLDTSNTIANSFTLSGFADITPLEGLKVTLNGSVYGNYNRYTSTVNPFYGYGLATYPGGYVYKENYNYYTLNFQQLVNYTRSFGRHNMTLLVGHENYKYQYDYVYGDRKNMFSYFENQELSGATTMLNNGSYVSGYNTEGFFFRGQYDYDGKYYGNISYRRDASSRFHPDNRWGNFYSFGGAWVLSKESWMEPVKWVDMLKLKASFGQNGNDNIGDFRYTDTYTINKGDANDIGLTLYLVGNKDITWETVTNINIGTEFELFDNRLRGSIDYFYRKTTDMLSLVSVPISMGYQSYYSNVGDMKNCGVEIELSGDVIRKRDLQWTLSTNLTTYKAEVTYLSESNKSQTLEGTSGYSSGYYFYGEGLPVYTWRLLKYAGVSDEGEALYYYYDTDGNLSTTTNPTNVSSSDANYFNCGTALPDFYGGFGTSVSFKGFDLSVDFAYSVGGKVMDYTYAQLMAAPVAGVTGMAYHKDMLNAWSADNTSSNIPRLQYGDTYSAYISDRFLIDGSWLSLQSVNLGYTFPRQWIAPLGLSSLRVYVSGENLTYWSKRKGLDPRSSFMGSITNTSYSPARSISGGVTVQF